MALIPFPNVPQVPGVPAVPRAPGVSAIASRFALGAVQAALWRVFQVETQWGIYDSAGKALGDPSLFQGVLGAAVGTFGIGTTLSTGGVDYNKETRVSDFPVERGSFANYNKVETPAEPVVTLRLGGSESARTTFLNAIDAAVKSTSLYSVVTPEVTYVNYTLERYAYSRQNTRGATLLTVEIMLKEVRQVSAQYAVSNKGNVNAPKTSSATPQIDSGKVQAATPPVSTLKSIANKLPNLSGITSSLMQGG